MKEDEQRSFSPPIRLSLDACSTSKSNKKQKQNLPQIYVCGCELASARLVGLTGVRQQPVQLNAAVKVMRVRFVFLIDGWTDKETSAQFSSSDRNTAAAAAINHHLDQSQDAKIHQTPPNASGF